MSAEWITPDCGQECWAFCVFKRRFSVEVQGEVRIKYGANSSLNIFIDSEKVVQDYNLKSDFYNTIELELEQGEHLLYIEANNFAELQVPQLWLEMAIGEEFVVSDKFWLSAKNLSYDKEFSYDANLKLDLEWGAVKVVDSALPTPKIAPNFEPARVFRGEIVAQGGLQRQGDRDNLFAMPPFRVFKNSSQSSFAQNVGGLPWEFMPNCCDWDGFFVDIDFQKKWYGDLDIEWEFPAGSMVDIAIDGQFKGRYIAANGVQKWSFPWAFEGRILRISLLLGGMGEVKIHNIITQARNAMLPEAVYFGCDDVALMGKIFGEAQELELTFSQLELLNLKDFRTTLWSANYLWGAAKWSEVVLSMLGERLALSFEEEFEVAVNWVTALCEDYLFYGRGDLYGRFEGVADKIVAKSLAMSDNGHDVLEMWSMLAWVLVDEKLKLKAEALQKKLADLAIVPATTKGVASNFFAHRLGIKPLEPGFREFEFAPHVEDCKQIFGEVHTPLGRLKVDMRATSGGMIADITGPSILKIHFKTDKKISACYWNGEQIEK